MDTVFWLLALQGVLGVFDIVYHHEITERLTWRRSGGNRGLSTRRCRWRSRPPG